MIVSKNGTIVSGSAAPPAYTIALAASATPTVVEHPLGIQPSALDFVDTGGIPHEVDWRCDTTFPFAVHLPAVLEAGTLTIR